MNRETSTTDTGTTQLPYATITTCGTAALLAGLSIFCGNLNPLAGLLASVISVTLLVISVVLCVDCKTKLTATIAGRLTIALIAMALICDVISTPRTFKLVAERVRQGAVIN